jgi:hypothetical protein
MEPTKILNGILNNEAHARLIAGEQLLTYLRNEDNDLEHFDQLEDLINGLVNWMSSSNFRVWHIVVTTITTTTSNITNT